MADKHRRSFPANPLKVRDRARARQLIGAEVERLIAYLDALDGDPDLEENGDLEPSLGAGAEGSDREGDLSDDEPSLGTPDRMVNQEHVYRQHAGSGGYVDHELDRSDYEDGGDTEPVCEDEGAQVDDEEGTDLEPSLGAPEIGVERSQEAWSTGARDDREQAVSIEPVFRRAFVENEREANHARDASRRLREIMARVNGAPANGSNLREVW